MLGYMSSVLILFKNDQTLAEICTALLHIRIDICQVAGVIIVYINFKFFSDICQTIHQNGRLLKIIEVTLKYQLQMPKFLRSVNWLNIL